jgi:predicted alpha/beta superfamily hydrolase
LIHVPDGCKEDGKSAPCPVLYILDGPSHFHYGSGMLGYMAGNSQIPEMIMVAVPNTDDRLHDLTPTFSNLDFKGKETEANKTAGGGDAFLDFLEKELVPEIEKDYSPMPYRVFSGHSLGGLMALHCLIERPDLFHAYIAVDSSLWWHDQELVKRAEAKLKSMQDVRNKVFITVADHRPRGEDNGTVMLTAAERFVYALNANGSPYLKAGLKVYPGHSHGSVAFPSLYDGLLFVFDGYMLPPAAVTSRGIDAVTGYYADYLAPWGITLQPPGSVFMDMARVAQGNGEADKAMAYLEHNLSLNPEDPMAHWMAALTYEEFEKTDLAIQHYERVLELAPEFATYVQPRLDALKE